MPEPSIPICNYISRNNEVTIKDLAEGFERTLRQCAGLQKDQPFDAIVVVCDPFLPSKHDENVTFLWASHELDLRIATVCLHPKDFRNRYFTLACEVARYGIVAWAAAGTVKTRADGLQQAKNSQAIELRHL